MLNDDIESDSERGYVITSKNRRPKPKVDLYVKNFGNEMTKEHLRELFSHYGTVTHCKITRDHYNHSNTFGLVSFLQSSMAEKALTTLNGLELNNGEHLCVQFCTNTEDDEQEANVKSHENRKLYIKNLDENVDDLKLKQVFSTYGKVKSARVMMKRGVSQGHGVVSFSTSDEANQAMNSMNGKKIGSKTIDITMHNSSRQSRVSSFYRYTQMLPLSRSRRTSSTESNSSRLSISILSPFHDRRSRYEIKEDNSNTDRRRSSSNSSGAETDQKPISRKFIKRYDGYEQYESDA